MTTATATRQDDQQATLDAAMDAPGVREVLEVYGPISGFTGTRITQVTPHLAYATGGNV